MSKIKEFWKKHKTKALVLGGVIVGGTAMYLLTRDPKHIVKTNLREKQIITWSRFFKNTVTLDSIKEFLDTNADTDASFAIVRELGKPSEYAVIALKTTLVDID